MTKTIKFTNIDYDTDGEKVDLPSELTIEVEDDEIDPSNEGADLISDETGWCVNHFDWEFV